MPYIKTALISMCSAMAVFAACPLSDALAASEYGDSSELTLLDGFGGFHHGDTRTQAQFDQENAIVNAHMATVETIKQRMQSLSEQISDLLSGSGALDTSSALSLEQQRSDLQAQRDATNLDMLMQIRALLTPAQLADVAQRHAQLKILHQQEQALTKTESKVAMADLHPDDLYGDDLGYERGLSLPAEEVDQIRAPVGHQIAPIHSLQNQLQAIRQQISDVVNSAGTVTSAQISGLQEQESALKQQLSMTRLEMVIQARAPLTPDQLARAASLHNQIVALQAGKTVAINKANSGN
jgi:Spy/CpxP family protein refolding chaperone